MPTAALPGTGPGSSSSTGCSPHLPDGSYTGGLPVRRRANLQQGFALETLAHAVEYLVDCRIFAQSEPEAQSDAEAIQLLMRMSRAVFAECAEVVPLRMRMGRWLGGRARKAS